MKSEIIISENNGEIWWKQWYWRRNGNQNDDNDNRYENVWNNISMKIMAKNNGVMKVI